MCVLYLFEGLSPLHYECTFSCQLIPFNQLTNSDFQLGMHLHGHAHSHSVENIPSVKQRGVERDRERMIMPKALMEQLGMNQIVPVRGRHYRAVTSPHLEEGAA